ncbi:NlpC/P60 family protein [Flavobacterium sp.]|jgi:cell wall-associated NlpC family hydrolase|uniref:C40 family peptidase n=1 Tax=Flavobacterium sp. TaxID=239 RepID=UPI002A7F4C58|nr:NlpC/P60 family protein [Flavobacterium sp.]
MRFFSNWIIVLILASTGVFAQNSVKHKVEQGESIYSIAKKYDVKENAIYDLNPTVKGKPLQLKTVLIIPSKGKPQVVNVIELPESHKVLKSETFYSISKKYKITVAQLEALNPEISPSNLKIDDVLNLSKDKIVSAPKLELPKESAPIVIVQSTELSSLENEIVYKVLPKETKYGISKKYKITIDELERLNPTIVGGLPIGAELVIKKKEAVVNAVVEENSNESAEKPIDTNVLAKADFLIEKASNNLGTRYRSGGTTSSGFDCSGLMFTTFQELDIKLPRSSTDMAKYGFEVSKSNAQKGDLIFFTTNRKGTISHVGMITDVTDDEIKFIHSSTSSGVIISSSNEDYYSRRFVQINRVLN